MKMSKTYAVPSAVFIVTFLLSFLLISSPLVTKMYQAEAVIYVPLTVFSKQMEQQGIGFASDKEIDGHIQIMKSGRLKDSLITKYHLDNTWGIDFEKPGAKNQLYNKLDSRINIQKTRYSSVSITVKDERAENAAVWANAIIELGDIIKEDLLYENRQNAFNYAKSLFEQKEKELERLESELSVFQVDSTDAASLLKYSRLRTLFNLKLQEMAGRKSHMEREEKNLETPLPKVYIITRATAPSSPSWPPKKLISIAVAAGALFIYLVFSSLRNESNRDKKQ